MSKPTDKMLSDAELDEALASLAPRVEPETDLWPGIANRLPPRQHNSWWQAMGWHGQAAVAASLLLAVIGLGTAGINQQQNQLLKGQLASLSNGHTGQGPSTDSGLLPVAAPINGTSCTSNSSESQVIQHNLAIIQSALNEINLALEKSPNNPALNKQLLDLSKQQINLINRANTITL